MTTKIAIANISQAALTTLAASGSGGPKISAIAYPGVETATDVAGGETITLTGSGFNSGASVIVNGVAAGVVTVVSSTSVTFTAPAQTAGTYPIYLVNSDGGTAIAVPGLSYSGVPSWSTAAGSLGTQYETTAVSQQLSATGDGSLTYSLASGTLPTGTTLSSAGLLSGTAPAAASATTYTFTVKVLDAQSQPTLRQFSLTVNPDVVTWSSPASGSTNLLNLEQTGTLNLVATSAAGKSITYSADTLPAGMAISGATITGIPTQSGTTSSTITATAATTGKTAQVTFSWTVSLAVDQYFKYTTLLLNSENVGIPFIADSSTNNFALTAAGDTRPHNFGPYQGSYYSNYFPGGGSRLAVSKDCMQLGTGDFTVECWVNMSTLANGNVFSRNWNGANFFILSVSATGQVGIWLGHPNGGWINPTSTATPIKLNQWHHLAVTRSGTTVKVFADGVEIITASSGVNLTSSDTTPVYIGWYFGDSTGMTGYISNLRVVAGTAVYTSAFTPPTSPLTAISGTTLLTCQSNRFIDNSSNAFVLTDTASPQIRSFIPFVPSTTYSTYGSAYFDGAGDYLTASSNAAFNFGTGDFTVEAWIYKTATGNLGIWTNGPASSGSLAFYIIANKLQVDFYGGTSTTGATTLVSNTWYHVAVSRSGTALRIFLNGAIDASATSSSNNTTSNCVIGLDWTNSTTYFSGYITDVRVVKGTAVYTANFTPPTSPLTAVTNTSLLTLQTNQQPQNNVVVDSSTNNFPITRNGNLTQGTFAPYGSNWSNYFEGTSAIQTPSSSITSILGTNGLTTSSVFTIECWIYQTQRHTITAYPVLVGDMQPTAANNYWSFGPSSTGVLQFYWFDGASKSTSGSTTVPLNTWTHIAVVVNATNVKMFVNGNLDTLSPTSTLTGAPGTVGYIAIGEFYSGGATNGFYGYVSNMRITKSALYSTSFTPSTIPLTPVTGTTLLTCQSPTFTDASYNAGSVTATGTPSVQRFSPFSNYIQTPQSYSTKFNGSTDYLTLPNNAALAFGTGDFTVEAWVNSLVSPGANLPICQSDAVGSSTNNKWWFAFAGGGLFFGTHASGGFSVVTTTAFSAGTWYHVAVTRASGVMKLFINGVSTAFTTSGTPSGYSLSQNGFTVGGMSTPSYWNGYISNLRVVNGTALYTATFTPSTTPLTAITNTQLLTCQDATIKDNSTNQFTITATGSPTPKRFNPFGYTNSAQQSYDPAVYGGSYYMDGTGAYAAFGTQASSAIHALAANKYVTYEFWVNTQAIQAVTAYTSAILGDAPGIYQDGRTMIELMASSTTSTQTVMYWWTINTGAADAIYSTIPMLQKSWNHVAITLDMTTPSSTTIKIYTNGVGETFTAKNLSTHAADNTNPTHFGAIYGGSDQNPTAYISDFRFTKDLVYTSNFVPPQVPLTAVKNTAILLSGSNAGGRDASMQTNIQTVGDVKITTTQKKYGTSSMYFDGTGDYLLIPGSQNTEFGSGDFTIELWWYPTSTVRQALYHGSFGTDWSVGIDYSSVSTNQKIGIWASSNGTSWNLVNADGGGNGIGTTTLTQNAWNHIAFVRSGTSWMLFVNGNRDVNVTGLSGTIISRPTSQRAIGAWWNTSGIPLVNGYIDDLRITKGYARYTANFTAPTAALLTK